MTQAEKKIDRAKYGAAAFVGLKGTLPNPFPRIMGPNAVKYVTEYLESGMTVDMVSRFEQAFAAKMGVKHCVAAPGCTNALYLCAEALKFQPGDEIIVSPITDYGNMMGMIKKNYIVVFADTEPGSPNISARTIEKVISPRTRAILLTHKTGLLCDMDPIMDLAKQHNLVVIEDACQAVCSTYKGRLAGTIGHIGAFSFDSEKTMGSDVGGCLITNDDAMAEYMRFIGQSRGAENKPGFGRLHTAAGQGLRMPCCTAAVTLAQLEIVDSNVATRDKMIRRITKLLAEIPGITPLAIPDYQEVYSCWMAGFNVDPKSFTCSPDEFAAECEQMGLTGAGMGKYYNMPEALTFLNEWATKKVYPYSMPPASRSYHYGPETCPQAKKFLETFIRWSTFCQKYTEEHCDLVANIVRAVADKFRK